MVIYHAITYYHILKCAIHKLKCHYNDTAILLVPHTLVHKCSGLFPEGQPEKIFDRVLFFQWNTNPPGGDKEIKLREINEQLADWFGKNYLDDFSEVNICSAAYYFGIWAAERHVKYNWFEEADGMLSKAYFLQESDHKMNPIRYQMAEDTGNYTGDNDCVIKKYINLAAQEQVFSDERIENFNVLNELYLLTPEHQKMLLKFFDVPQELHFESNSALVLTQHFANMRLLSYEHQILIYQLTLDYYLGEYSIYFKLHPSDLADYASAIENVTILSGQFPSELLLLLLKEPIEVCCSIESSGTKNLAPICKRILLFERDYITTTFLQNHRYYFCLKIMEIFPAMPVCAIGMSRTHLENLLEFGDLKLNNEITYIDTLEEVPASEGPRLYLIGNIRDFDADKFRIFINTHCESDIFLFLNANDENYFFEFRNQIPYIAKEIVIRATDQHTYGTSVSVERIFIFSRDQEAMECIKKMKYVKQLLQTGVETIVFPSTDKDVQIAALKGMLKATEVEMNIYREENRKLKAIVEKLQV